MSVIHMSNIFFSFILNLIMTIFNINKFMNLLFIDSKFQVMGQKIILVLKINRKNFKPWPRWIAPFLLGPSLNS